MRNWKFIIRGFAIASCITTFTACEDSQPARRPPENVAVTTPAPVEMKTPPPKIEAPKVETPVATANDNTDDEDDNDGDAVKVARDALEKGELNRALKLARLAVKKQPKRSAAWNTLGRTQLKRGERKDAIASFEKAVELNPSSSYAQNNLGLALIYDGKYSEAVDALEEATELEPVESYMFNNLGMAYEHLDRLDEARDAYRQAFELDGEHAKENLARLEGVKSIRTAKNEVKDPVVPVEPTPSVDGGAE
jgi:Flp pilus assembly protein TadD